jgi:hypothetical protein
MSVRTPADECLDEAKEHIEKAIKSLSSIVIEQVSGSDEYSKEAKGKQRRALNELISIRDDF